MARRMVLVTEEFLNNLRSQSGNNNTNVSKEAPPMDAVSEEGTKTKQNVADGAFAEPKEKEIGRPNEMTALADNLPENVREKGLKILSFLKGSRWCS